MLRTMLPYRVVAGLHRGHHGSLHRTGGSTATLRPEVGLTFALEVIEGAARPIFLHGA